MSSAYYIGPFGRMLPIADGPAEQEPDRPANLSVPGSHPYQLPPPRTSAPLQFGTDPFLRPRNRADRLDEREEPSVYSSSHGYQQTNEQLPSVSQLLTPTAQLSRSPSPYNPSAFGIYLAPHEPGESPQRYNETTAPPTQARSSIYERSRAFPDVATSPQSKNLPPISHISTHAPGRNTPTYLSNNLNSIHPPYLPSFHGYNEEPNGRNFMKTPSLSTTELSQRGASGKSAKPQVRLHVVDERFIEGEGLCYIYADGSHCPKIIDGMPVNANWGVTKAGKPRKRLAQACLTCREKKIKCHPNLPKCDQCQKSGRECRFESALPYLMTPCLRLLLWIATITTLAIPTRQYATRPQHLPGERERMPRHSTGSAASSPSADYAEILTEIKDLDEHDPLATDWRTDPYAVDPESATHFTELYFTYVNDRLYYLFPRRRFLLWLKSCHTKSLADNMLLYCIMALGSVFSDRPGKITAMRRYSRIATYALEHSQHSLSLQLAQSRIIISLWYYAIGALVKSWDAAGAAVRTVCGLRYNVEMGGVIVEQSQPCEYGLHPQALIECRRRTFWIAFLTDRLSCFYAPSTTFISSQTAFLRLPCREEIYEAQEYTTVPFFQNFLNQVPSESDELSNLSVLALLIDVISHDGAIIQARNTDHFISIHLLYHAALLKLNRYARAQLLRPGMAKQYVHTARNHAAEILRTALALERYASDHNVSPMTADPTPRSETLLLDPFLGYIILSAVDVLSAGGLVIDLPECINLIRGGLDVVRDLSSFWNSTKPLVSATESRLEALIEAHRSVSTSRTTLEGRVAFLFDGPSLDSQIQNGVQKQDSSVNEDLLYGGLPREQLFLAFGVMDVSCSLRNVVWVRARRE
ncbi:hypothetical protein AN8177.2 [Aspergillus nidulans FGSC A4]|uniref:Zn(II)2Cys6 transcription factor (Eurofung) n=1 Tax=Emericella nidulans (strain FGSC A4 / ATCC 38163 / CBS 112.46 / NRRL 194 / M139) TaxID=227321 RepID=Q5AU53_EMENI|nr:hypothetical protein [Aspergillus nidulans FGSC A4]EAA59199.1 hypothetical protein AN8177.2 [Aspergillus nidulans FGSC A4]CBF74045.1 TPA: Putative Zn(II)2Cys6 transcription factor (Eurofung) [Aspergillus nidulans FGSC A4]|eukprot:XP_681446.1 hypothetical protein AN8177.2 [Aspergillus nidulans FGSC A4]